MTEYSIKNNDLTITNTPSHLSSPHLPQNSPQNQYHHNNNRHHIITSFTQSSATTIKKASNESLREGNVGIGCGTPSSSFERNSNSNIILSQRLAAQLNRNLLQTHNQTLVYHKNNQQQQHQTLNVEQNVFGNNVKSPSSVASSATHSPIHYRNPLNSPNNSPFSYNATCYANNNYNKYSEPQQKQQKKRQHQHQQHQQHQQQHYRYNSGCRIPLLAHNQHRQHLNDLLLQQQHLAKHQQQLLEAKDTDNEELSEESLKQNVAIVLNNLNRYNNALRSIILSEQVSSGVDGIKATGRCGGFGGLYNTGTDVIDDIGIDRESCLINNNLFESNMSTTVTTPESDYNSNPATPGCRTGNVTTMKCDNNVSLQHNTQHLIGYSNGICSSGCNDDGVGGDGCGNGCGGGSLNNRIGGGDSGNNAYLSNNLTCSLGSTSDFTHDNSDYQWFLDCGYRDGFNGMQRSVLSSLSASFNAISGDFIYEDMSKHLDANLAQADIESFRTKDIQLLLSQIPSYCKNLSGSRLQQSLLMQQQINMQNIDWEENDDSVNYKDDDEDEQPDSQNSHNSYTKHQQQEQQQKHGHHQQTVSQTSTSASINDLMINNSICKSELLFSPVKESHISVDSLDMDCYPEDEDIILTYKANKDNYTIAFEGSVLYSDDSFYEPNEIALKNKQNFSNLHNNLDDNVKRKSLDASMAHSERESANNKVTQRSDHMTQLQRYPSGNNNTGEIITIIRPPVSVIDYNGSIRKSSSLPNLKDNKDFLVGSQIKVNNLQGDGEKGRRQSQSDQYKKLNVSQAISTSNVEPNLCAKGHNLLPMCQMPISCNSISDTIEDHKDMHDHLQKEEQKKLDQQMVYAAGKKTPQQHHDSRPHKHRCCCGITNNQSNGSDNNSLAGSTTHGSHRESKRTQVSASALSSGSSNPPAFNLVKLFIKQKSSNCSLEDQSNTQTCMDVSSGCWPSSDLTGSSTNSSMEQLICKKSMNDSGKGSGLSRHEEEEEQEQQEKAIFDSNNISISTFQIDTQESIPKRPSCSPGVYCDEDITSNSSGSLTATNSPAHHIEKNIPLRNPTLKYLLNSPNKNSNSSMNLQLSDNNSSDQLTQVFRLTELSSKSNVSKQVKANEKKQNIRKSKEKEQKIREGPQISHASSSEMITRSMQTSYGSLHSNRSSLSGRFCCVPPSFLEKLNNLGEERQAPIYVIYPNYALPDLAFVKHSVTPDIIFSPFNYKMTLGGVTSSANSANSTSKKCSNLMNGSEQTEILRTVDYKHVVDWVSLITLLPPDYRQRLRHIPEVKGAIKQLESELSHKPLFCSSSSTLRNSSHICDCAQYYQRNQEVEGGGSFSSGSTQQPSSGYRGSSTLLTDSENGENITIGTGAGIETGIGIVSSKVNNTADDTLKQMYVYQYEQQRMDGAIELSPKVQTVKPPELMPRGILRKSSSAVRYKRNSMIEPGEQQQSHQLYQGCSKLSKIEKRRSLQEPPYQQRIRSSEELTEVFEDGYCEVYPSTMTHKTKERLSRKDLNARVRAENFLSTLPRHELKYYAEIAAILESSDQNVKYDAAALKKEVSWALSQQKKVSFNEINNERCPRSYNAHSESNTFQRLAQGDTHNKKQRRFTTPPNSPNISMGRVNSNSRHRLKWGEVEKAATAAAVQRKQECNRFKRMQIQWELMSEDSSMLKELSSLNQTKSGATTPTSTAASALKSRIPRPVSFPTGKKTVDNIKVVYAETNDSKHDTKNAKPLQKSSIILSPPQIVRLHNQSDNTGKLAKSPSRIVPPKRYTMPSIPLSTPNTPTITLAGRGKTASNRTAVTAPNTPKRRIQSPRTLPMTR